MSREPSIRLDKEHGLNPFIPNCFFCNEQKNEIVLLGAQGQRVTGHKDASQAGPLVLDHAPCQKCEDLMKQGILLISAKDGEESDNPYRTGGWCVIKEDAFKKVFTGDIVEKVMKCRFAFVPDEVWDGVGLPRDEAINNLAGTL